METLIFFSFLAAVILVPVYLRSRDRAHLYDTLRQAYAQGQPVPPELIETLQHPAPWKTGPEGDLRRGVVLLVLGLGVCLVGALFYYGLWAASPVAAEITCASIVSVGAVPALLGAAFLMLARWGHRQGAARS